MISELSSACAACAACEETYLLPLLEFMYGKAMLKWGPRRIGVTKVPEKNNSSHNTDKWDNTMESYHDRVIKEETTSSTLSKTCPRLSPDKRHRMDGKEQ